MHKDFERRVIPSLIETRASGDTLTLTGYAVKWNLPSSDLGGFRERVSRGAAKKTIREGDIRALFNHNASLILARTRSGTLKLSEDSTGLHYEVQGDLRQTYVSDLAVAVERGDVSQSSFGFRVVGPEGQAWELDAHGTPLRTLRELQLFDVGPATFPAHDSTTARVRAVEQIAEARGLNIHDVRRNLTDVVAGRRTPPLPAPLPELVGEDLTALRLAVLNLRAA